MLYRSIGATTWRCNKRQECETALLLPRGRPPSSEDSCSSRLSSTRRIIQQAEDEQSPYEPIVPSTAPLSRLGTAAENQKSSGIMKDATTTTALASDRGSPPSLPGRNRQRQMTILDEALAEQARERLQKMREANEPSQQGQWGAITAFTAEGTGAGGGGDFQALSIDTGLTTTSTTEKEALTTGGEDGGGIESPKHHPGFTPGPGFRKKLVNKDAEFDFPTDEDGLPIHPPASPISPIHRKQKTAPGGGGSKHGNTEVPSSFGFDGMGDLAEGSEGSELICSRLLVAWIG